MSRRPGPSPKRARRPARGALARILTACPEAFVELDASGIVTEWNPEAEAAFGWRRDEVVGQRAEETVLAPRLDGAALGHLARPAGLLGHAKAEGNGDGTAVRRCLLELVTGSGERLPVEALVIAVDEARDCSYGGVAAFLRRLDRLPAARPAAGPPPAALPAPDPVTGLLTREHFEAELARALAGARRPGSVAVVLLDLDRFREVNLTWGRSAGDAVLSAVAGRLRRLVDGAELLGRGGGDGFVALFSDTGGEARRAASAFVERARGALAEPVVVSGVEVFVDATAGVALNTFGIDDAATLLANAEVAMCEAREVLGKRAEVFAEHLRFRAADRISTEHGLRRALERDELVLHYQPVVELVEMVPAGAEALVRWAHPHRGLLPPGRFIPVAEESGLILPIGTWVIERACAQLQAWEDGHRSLAGRSVEVNLSARQIDDPRLVRTVEKVLARTGLPPACLTLEITESALVAEGSEALLVMGALKQLGVQLAIDDFGTGYSSLSHLQRFPVDVLKVDRTFVSVLGRSAQADRIVSAVVGLAHALGLQVVAEGVETVSQLAALRDLGCDFAQGHLFSPPVPADELGPELTLPLSA